MHSLLGCSDTDVRFASKAAVAASWRCGVCLSVRRASAGAIAPTHHFHVHQCNAGATRQEIPPAKPLQADLFRLYWSSPSSGRCRRASRRRGETTGGARKRQTSLHVRRKWCRCRHITAPAPEAASAQPDRIWRFNAMRLGSDVNLSQTEGIDRSKCDAIHLLMLPFPFSNPPIWSP